MNRKIFGALFASAVFAASLFAAGPVEASTVQMCAPLRTGAGAGPARWTAAGSSTTYSLNARGCAGIAAADLGDARAAGFTLGSPYGVVVKTGISSTDGTTNTVTIPASTFIQRIIVRETSGATPTGMIKIGTSSTGSQVCCTSNQQPLLNTTRVITDGDLKLTVFSATAPQTLYFDLTAGFNSSSLDFTVIYGYF